MTTTVRELMEMLLKVEDLDAEVVLQKDSEGNGYSPLVGADPNAVYIPDTTWSGEVYDTTMSAEDAGMDEDEWEDLKSRPHCVVLFPVN